MADRRLVSEASLPSRASKYVRDCAQQFLHLLGYYALLSRKGTRVIQVAGFRLTIHATVYDPRFYRAPAYFAEFIGHLDLSGKSVADLCTGCGIQALAAVRAGAAKVVAIDINPIAAVTAGENARKNGFESKVVALASNLFSAVAAEPHFDVIVVNPPFCDGEAWDVADRAWRAGPAYRDILDLFEQSYHRLSPEGVMYMVNSSHADLVFLEDLIRRAGFQVKVAGRRRVLMETIVIYELRPSGRR